MNEVLNIKINPNLSKIIGKYLLPNVDEFNITDHLRELMNRTSNILHNLSYNEHYSDSCGTYVYGLLNTKIRKINNGSYHYWTIRNI